MQTPRKSQPSVAAAVKPSRTVVMSVLCVQSNGSTGTADVNIAPTGATVQEGGSHDYLRGQRA